MFNPSVSAPLCGATLFARSQGAQGGHIAQVVAGLINRRFRYEGGVNEAFIAQ